MTQVITVSATTAALAMEALKPQVRTPASMAAREARNIAARRGNQNDEPSPVVSAISSTEVALDLLTLGHRQPQAGMRQALESYEESI